LVENSRRQAEFCLQAGIASAAWSHCGFAVECALKAAIMHKERLNSWPSREARRELHTHDLQDLAKILGWQPTPQEDVAPAWNVVVKWRRGHMYTPDMPHVVARDLYDATFGEEGVVTWISQCFLKL
jgi:hypothetical protein